MGPAFLTNITHATGLLPPQKLLWEALPALRLTQGIPQTRLATPGDTLPRPALMHSRNQLPTDVCVALADLQPNKGLHSPLNFSSTLCQPSQRFSPLLGRWHSNKSKTVTSGVVVTDTKSSRHTWQRVRWQSTKLCSCRLQLGFGGKARASASRPEAT